MTKRKRKELGVVLEEHPTNPGKPDITGHRQLKKMKMGVRVRGKEILQELKKRLDFSKRDLGLVENVVGERRL